MLFALIGFVVTLLVIATVGFVIYKKYVKREKYENATLLDMNNIRVPMGTGYPPVPITKVRFDEDPSAPRVEGKTGPRSMFMMAFNKCSPDCCPSTYSCSGGCVCMTKGQTDFVSSRGYNSGGTKVPP